MSQHLYADSNQNKEKFKYSSKQYNPSKEKYQYDYNQQRLERKITVLKHYSNNKLECNCKHCNETDIKYLTIDHINPVTKLNKKEWSYPLYQKLIKTNFPSGYQVLCGYCNQKKSIYNECNHYQKPEHMLLKKETFNHYSNNNIKCKCCSNTNIYNLTIDHINGNGRIHRKSIRLKGGINFYRWLIKNNFPSGYQVLCSYCNIKKGESGNCDCQTNPLLKII